MLKPLKYYDIWVKPPCSAHSQNKGHRAMREGGFSSVVVDFGNVPTRTPTPTPVGFVPVIKYQVKVITVQNRHKS
jgi:hypothetical protein